VDHTCKYTTSAFPSYTHSLEDALLLTVSPIYRPIYYSFPVPLRVGGWVGLVGWPIADALPAILLQHYILAWLVNWRSRTWSAWSSAELRETKTKTMDATLTRTQTTKPKQTQRVQRRRSSTMRSWTATGLLDDAELGDVLAPSQVSRSCAHSAV